MLHVNYYLLFTEVPDLRSSVITFKVLWFNLILDFNFNFFCLWYSCVSKVHSQIAVIFFSSTKRGYKCTLVQSENCFNLQYRQSFFLLQNNIENSRRSPMTWTFGTSVHTCQGFDWCKLDPISIVCLININLKMQWACL